jgi:hypothetical protein
MLTPHATDAGFVIGQRGAHTQRSAVQVSPVGQRAPDPGHACPGHTFTRAWPQSTPVGEGHDETHSQRLFTHACPSAQRVPCPQEGLPGQSLATSSPQVTSAGDREQRASHTQRPPAQIDPASQRVP